MKDSKKWILDAVLGALAGTGVIVMTFALIVAVMPPQLADAEEVPAASFLLDAS